MPKRRRRIAAVVGIALGVYVLLAALPYAFPPAAERAQAAFVPVEDGAEGDRATILTTGEQALAARLNLIANAVRAAGEGGGVCRRQAPAPTVAGLRIFLSGLQLRKSR